MALGVSCTVAAAAVALKSTIVGEPTALLVTVILPVTLPAAVGLYAAVRVALVPAAKVTGVVTPEIAMVETEGVMLEIVTFEVPMFCKRIVWVVSLPITTFPKLKDAGVAASVERVAVPLTPIEMLGSDALLAIDTLPASVPAAVGLYVTVRFAVCPAANVIGAAIPETLTPAPEIVILEIAAASPPVFSK